MSQATVSELTHRHCLPCEGGVPKVSPEQVTQYLRVVTSDVD